MLYTKCLHFIAHCDDCTATVVQGSLSQHDVSPTGVTGDGEHQGVQKWKKCYIKSSGITRPDLLHLLVDTQDECRLTKAHQLAQFSQQCVPAR